uniref:Sphingosine-1-phosphate lyase 1 n=1 Tax=Seriola dumerili TaxID=41447 RepID=A0A3B4V5F5_SERDU
MCGQVSPQLLPFFFFSPLWLIGLTSRIKKQGFRLIRKIPFVYGDFAWSNPLHPDIFSWRKEGWKAEVVRMACALFQAGPAPAVTSGGTESILMACKAYKTLAVLNHDDLFFSFSAHYFGNEAEAINKNTAMARIFPPLHLAVRYNLRCMWMPVWEVFLIVFMAKAGYPLAPFDFRVKGVTRISADTPQYGYAPKYFVLQNWPGGNLRLSPPVAGSRQEVSSRRAGRPMIAHGRETDTLERHQGRSSYSLSLFVFRGIPPQGVSVGWNLNTLQYPSSIHNLCTVLPHPSRRVADSLLRDSESRFICFPLMYPGAATSHPVHFHENMTSPLRQQKLSLQNSQMLYEGEQRNGRPLLQQ